MRVPKILVTGERVQLLEGASQFLQELQMLTSHKSIKIAILIQKNDQSQPGAYF